MQRSIGAFATVLLVTLAACSSSAPASSSQKAAVAKTEMHFDLSACQDLGGGLYKCPAVDRPICNPGYKGQTECVRVGTKGNVFVETRSGLVAGQWILEGPGYIPNP